MVEHGEAYTVSKMLNSINETMGGAGSVQLKRNVGNGIALDTSAKDIAFLDTQAKIKTSVERVAAMGAKEKREWVAQRRAKGNELFHQGLYREASDTYLEALTGLNLSQPGDDHEIQQAITCNIAACLLKLQEWEKVVKMTTVVLTSQPTHIKALLQRSKAYMKLEEFEKSSADATKAQALDVADPSIPKQLECIHRAQLCSQRQRREKKAFEKSMMKKMGSLYADKKDLVQNESPRVNGWRAAIESIVRALIRAISWCVGKRKQS